MKLGQQIKCKIIPRLNKLKLDKEQFDKVVDNNLENIDYYYDSLIGQI